MVIGKYDLDTKCVDGSLFIVNKSRASKGIKIYSGANFNSIKKRKLQKTDCYVSEKDGFTAHGETVKKSIGDLQFKIIAEKLKNDPIKEDTVISIQYYRIVTGACELGCKEWMRQNKVTKKVESGEMTAKELFPMLDKTGAYGFGRFRELVDFEY